MDFTLHLSPAAAIVLILALAALVLAHLATKREAADDLPAEPQPVDNTDPALLNFPTVPQ